MRTGEMAQRSSTLEALAEAQAVSHVNVLIFIPISSIEHCSFCTLFFLQSIVFYLLTNALLTSHSTQWFHFTSFTFFNGIGSYFFINMLTISISCFKNCLLEILSKIIEYWYEIKSLLNWKEKKYFFSICI